MPLTLLPLNHLLPLLFLKCFQKKITFLLHRGTESIFNTNKRLPFIILFFLSQALIHGDRKLLAPNLCQSLVTTRPVTVQSPVLCFSHKTIPFSGTHWKTGMCLLPKIFPAQVKHIEKRKNNIHKQCFLFNVIHYIKYIREAKDRFENEGGR